MIQGLLDSGIRRVLSLMEATEKARGGREFVPYRPLLQRLAGARGTMLEFLNLPIRDASAPSHARMHEILEAIEDGLTAQAPTYVHCWGGHGRTSTVVACHLIRRGSSPEEAIEVVLNHRRGLPRNHYPFEGSQEEFVRSWSIHRSQPEDRP
jgi:hypothetical protein